MSKRPFVDALLINGYGVLTAFAFVFLYQRLLFLPFAGGQLAAKAGFGGLLNAIAGCVFCLIPLTCALAPSEEKATIVFVRLLWFHIGRLISLFLYACAGEVIFTWIKKWHMVAAFLAGSIMIILGGLIFLNKKWLPDRPLKNAFYCFWGMTIGYGCSIEATAFLLPLWIEPGSFTGKVFSFFIFSVISIFFPLAILAPLATIKKGESHLVVVMREICYKGAGIFLVLLGGLQIQAHFR